LNFVRFYRYKDQLVIPTVVQAEEGFYMDVDPVAICQIADQEEVRRRIMDVLSAGDNQVVPTPERADEPGSAVLERLRLRKWRVFEAEAVMFTIYLNPNGIEYYSTGPAVGGEWKMRAGKHISLPSDTDSSHLVNIIVQELNEAASASESGKPGGLMLLPPPSDT
jgi:hypothetical protein